MVYSVVAAPIGAKVADHFGHVTLAQCKALRADGFDALMLYAEVVDDGDLSAATGADLLVGFVLEGLAKGTVPSAALGSQIAANGIGALRRLSIPDGLTLFGDFEGIGHAPGQWIAYANAAADTTAALGHIPGGYFGGGCGLTSEELYALHTTRYAKGAARVQDSQGRFAEPACGWCWVQGFPTDYAHHSGLAIDVGAMWSDYQGRLVSLLRG